MATNPNETYPYTIVHATRWSKGGRAERKTRLVVLRFNLPAGSTKYRYAMRWQTDGGEDGPTFGGGAYQTRRAAQDAMMKTYLAHNAVYGKGSISHLPGIAK
jgi:hypothetical protein